MGAETAMNFQQAIVSGFQNYVGFSGRAPRSAYWYWVLFAILVSIVAGILDRAMFPFMDVAPLGAVTGVLLFLPGLAVGIRRLHDVDHSGWWVLIAFTIIGILLLLYWAVIRGTVGANHYGPDPLG
jgi:uncharacterized membrane protein YhaH (DUF805 family)